MVLSVLLPLFLLPSLGWFFTKYPMRPNDWATGTRELTTYLLIPCLLFTGMYENGLPQDASLRLLLAFYLPLLLHFMVVWWFFRRHPARAALLLGSHYSNSVYVGLPVVQAIVGDSGLQYLFPIVAFQALLVFGLYYLVAHGDSPAAMLPVLSKTLRNPIVGSLLLGLACNLLQLPLPAFLLEALAMVAEAALPCVLLVMGASMASFSVQGKAVSLWVVGQKILTIPLLVWLLSWLFHLPKEAQQVVVILAACPVAVSAYVLLESENESEAAQMVGSSILLSSLLFILSLPLVVWLL